MDIKHLNQVQLARRWSLSPRTLERWRYQGLGPRYLKIVGRVVYRLEDIEAFETERAREGKAMVAGTSANKHAQLRASTQQ
jgi:predicted site-specific integrase-resolvase